MFAEDQKAAWLRLANAALEGSEGGLRAAICFAVRNGQHVVVVARTLAVGTAVEAMSCE